MKWKIAVLAMVVVFAGMAVAPCSSASDKVYTIRIGNVTPPNNPLHKAFEMMAKEMNEKSNGRIEATAPQIGRILPGNAVREKAIPKNTQVFFRN